jgi:hypothetical protein
MSYSGFITLIKEIRKHPNADRLFLTSCFGNQCIIDGNYKIGDIVIYFPTDGRLSEEFCEVNNLIGHTDPATGIKSGGYFDSRRKVSTLKLRKEVSDGFVIPIESLSYTGVNLKTLKEGMMITEVNSHKICEKYITVATRSQGQNQGKKNKKGLKETIQYPNFHEHKDTENICYNYNQLKKGDVLIISCKMHGTSFRVSYTEEKKFTKLTNFINNIFKKELIKPKISWKYIAGTRRVVIKNKDKYKGFYNNEDFREKAHNQIIGKLNKGETVYGEIVGYVSENTTIMPSVSNKKMDKEFIKQYGEETIFSYGCLPGQSEIYIYRMSITNSEGYEVDYTWETIKRRCEEMNIKTVIELDKFMYDGNEEELKKKIEILADGKDPIGNHIREGCVIRINDCKWKVYKSKNTNFKIIEGIIKDNEQVIDIEEQEDSKKEEENI